MHAPVPAAAGRQPGRARGRWSRAQSLVQADRSVPAAPPEPSEQPCPAEVEARLSVLLRWS